MLGPQAVQKYLVDEVQRVYRSQGVTINDKHIEVIVRQMLRKVRGETPGDTELLPGELVDRFTIDEVNARVLAQDGEPATAKTVLLGVTKASLNTDQLPGRGLVPGDDARADRRGHLGQEGPPDGPEGERDHRQADPGWLRYDSPASASAPEGLLGADGATFICLPLRRARCRRGCQRWTGACLRPARECRRSVRQRPAGCRGAIDAGAEVSTTHR